MLSIEILNCMKKFSQIRIIGIVFSTGTPEYITSTNVNCVEMIVAVEQVSRIMRMKI